MRAAVIVEADPVGDDAGRVLDALEAMAMNALLLERADDPLDHAVLLLTCHGSFIQPRPEPGYCLRQLAQVEQSPDARSFHLAQRGG